MKKRTMLFLLPVLLLAMALPVFAATGEEVLPLYTYIRETSAGLEIDESTGGATCTGAVAAFDNQPVEILVQLQVYKDGAWKTLMSWSNTGTMNASVNQYYTVESGYQYRVKATGYVCNDLGLPIESAVTEKYVTYPSN